MVDPVRIMKRILDCWALNMMIRMNCRSIGIVAFVKCVRAKGGLRDSGVDTNFVAVVQPCWRCDSTMCTPAYAPFDASMMSIDEHSLCSLGGSLSGLRGGSRRFLESAHDL